MENDVSYTMKIYSHLQYFFYYLGKPLSKILLSLDKFFTKSTKT